MGKSKIEEKHYKMTLGINQGLLGTHVCLLLLFTYLKIDIMVYVNICSILLYICMFFTYKKSIVRYVAIVFVEVLAHMFMATICLGWDAGFQFYSFCLLPCIFLCDYLARTDHFKGMHPIGVSFIVMIFFILSKWYCVLNGSIYVLDNSIQYTAMFTYNLVVSFAFLLVYLTIFENQILNKERELENMAEIDELTKLPNRHLMQQWLTEGFRKNKQGKSMAIAMLDVDNFKNINDVYGHNCGDFVLKLIAEKIQTNMKDSARAGRWGGEEFLFLNTGETSLDQFQEALESLRKDIEKTIISFEGQDISVTVTIGATRTKKGDRSFLEIIQRADEYMYNGKNSGKNRVIKDED